MKVSDVLRKGRDDKAARVIERLREEFKTCTYVGSGAYGEIPTRIYDLERRLADDNKEFDR